MWSLAWPWALAALPLPYIIRRLLPEAKGLSEAGLKVPNLETFSTLRDREARRLRLAATPITGTPRRCRMRAACNPGWVSNPTMMARA